MEKVSVRKCMDYEEARGAVKKCIEDLGGIDISADSRVLIKTNLLKMNSPKEMVTTHPRIIEGVVYYLQEKGVYNIVIADSPGGPFNAALLKGVYKMCGMEQVSKSTGAVLNYDTGSRDIYNKEGVILKHFSLCDFAVNADFIIDCAKLKTHQMTGYTGCVKNLFGCIPGTKKVDYHYRMPKLKDFSNMLLDLALYIKPQLCIIDAVYGMEGEGPSAGNPRKVGAVIGSRSAIHADMAGITLMGMEPMDICTIQRAQERGLIKGSLKEDVSLIGDDINSLIVHDFVPSPTKDVKLFHGRVPKFLQAPLEKAFTTRPEINESKCVKCGICRDSCPPKAISMEGGFPKIDREMCIKCYCCHELCPKRAIGVKRGFSFRRKK